MVGNGSIKFGHRPIDACGEIEKLGRKRMEIKFGTSGLRGPAKELLDGSAARFAVAFARHLIACGKIKPGSEIAIGRDLRASSPDLASTCIDALLEAGMRPIDCGITATPALALFARNRGLAAIMVSGSHIPADRNGLKFYRPDGEIEKADESAISSIAAETFPAAPTPRNAGVPSGDSMQLYERRYSALADTISLDGLRVGVYQHSSVLRDFLPDLLTSLGAQIVPLGRSEVFVPVDTEALDAADIDRAARWIRQHRLAAVVSTDADGDRPLILDETGAQIRGDVLGLLTSRLLGAQGVVTPVTSSSATEHVLDATVVRTRVGSPYVIAGMQKLVAHGLPTVVGYEANGGFLMASQASLGEARLDSLPTRDSTLPILAVLHQARCDNTSLSELVASLRLPVSLSGRLQDYPSEASGALMAWLAQGSGTLSSFLGGEVDKMDDTDGLRCQFANGEIVHLRPSGNAPEMRCYVEAASEERASNLLARMLQRLSDWRGDGGADRLQTGLPI